MQETSATPDAHDDQFAQTVATVRARFKHDLESHHLSPVSVTRLLDSFDDSVIEVAQVVVAETRRMTPADAARCLLPAAPA